MVQLTISPHWFSQWLGAEQVSSHYLNQYWPCSLTHICGTRGRWVKVYYIIPGESFSNFAQSTVVWMWCSLHSFRIVCVIKNKLKINEILLNFYWSWLSEGFCILSFAAKEKCEIFASVRHATYGGNKKVSPLLTHWRYCSLALSNRYRV